MDRPEKNEKPVVWLKIGKHFVDETQVRGFVRKGKGTLIQLVNGEEILVDIEYEKVIRLLPKK